MSSGVFSDLVKYDQTITEIKRLQSLPKPEVTVFKCETSKSNWFSQVPQVPLGNVPLDKPRTRFRLKKPI